jgi:hypothetical protein
MDHLAFACLALDPESARQTLWLASGLRRWGGELAGAPFLVLVPRGDEACLEGVQSGLEQLGVRVDFYPVDPQAAGFPFARKVLAAAAAEQLAAGLAIHLAWMDSGALILQPPALLDLPAGARLAARPVDLALIGSPVDQPPGPFWEQLYTDCGVSTDRIFPVISTIDRVAIRPYVNAGLLVVRPQDGLLGAWRDDFLRLHARPEYLPFYQANPRYRLFMHQAVLSAVILNRLHPSEIHWLPPWVNYPLHFHHRYPQATRPLRLDDLVTCRYENLFDQPGWQEKIPPTSPPLQHWLEGLLAS